MPNSIEGYIDDKGRPRVSITLAGLSYQIDAVVDTGFNGALRLELEHAYAAGLDLIDDKRTTIVASGDRAHFLLADGDLEWFGEVLTKSFLVKTRRNTRDSGDEGREMESIALLGCELLVNTKLEVDYCSGTVRITPC